MVFEWLWRGITILNFMNWTAEDIMHNEDENDTYAATATTRSEEQVRRHKTKAIRDPPREWSKIKALFNIYAIFLRAMFSCKCGHFKGAWTLRNAIAGMNGQEERHYNQNGGYLCKLIVWRTLVDARQFFATALMLPITGNTGPRRHPVIC